MILAVTAAEVVEAMVVVGQWGTVVSASDS